MSSNNQAFRHSVHRLRKLIEGRGHRPARSKILKDELGREIVEVICEDCLMRGVMISKTSRVKGAALYRDCNFGLEEAVA